MSQALIGHTGFVGGCLKRQASFSALFNSSNFRDMEGQHFDRVVCAGLPAAKWLIAKDPATDWANIEALQSVLKNVSAREFWLISTVDVYPDPAAGVNEDFDPTGLDNHAYGKHRLAFENFIRLHFDRAVILRLPGLYGAGLKKNILFDLLNDNCLEMINPDSRFQWYNMERLWADAARAAEAGLERVNLMTAPVVTRDILSGVFPHKIVGTKAGPTVSYDIRTRHAGFFGGQGEYIEDSSAVLAGIRHFIQQAQAA